MQKNIILYSLGNKVNSLFIYIRSEHGIESLTYSLYKFPGLSNFKNI